MKKTVAAKANFIRRQNINNIKIKNDFLWRFSANFIRF